MEVRRTESARDRRDEAKDAASTGRDLMDSTTDAWRVERPELDRPEYELVKRAVRLSVRLEDALAECLVPWGLTKADYGVLSVLRFVGAPYELRPTDLKARLMLTSGGVSNVLNRLEKAGLIQRVWDSADGRSSWVQLTGAGLEMADAIVSAWAETQADIFRAVPADVSRAAADALRPVLIALGDREPPAARTRKRGSQSPSTSSSTG
jgi:DNA-binding MarR family transcriptional regulator